MIVDISLKIVAILTIHVCLLSMMKNVSYQSQNSFDNIGFRIEPQMCSAHVEKYAGFEGKPNNEHWLNVLECSNWLYWS